MSNTSRNNQGNTVLSDSDTFLPGIDNDSRDSIENRIITESHKGPKNDLKK